MMGISEAAAAASVLSTARKLLGELLQSGLSEKHAPLVSKTLEVVNDGLDRVAQLQAKIIELQQQNHSLTELLKSVDDWNARIGRYQLTDTEGGGVVWASTKQAVPHFACPNCVESKKQIHILQPGSEWTGAYDCPACESSFNVRRPRPTPDSSLEPSY